MQVFKLYFKILKRGLIIPLILYVAIFSVLTIVFTNFSKTPTEQAFNVEKCRVAILDNDGSELSLGLSDYIKNNSEYVVINDTSEEGLKDSIFFRYAEYILIIPKDFGEKFFTDNKPSLQTMRIPGSASSMLLDSMVNKYLNTFKIYMDVGIDKNIPAAIEKTADSLKLETVVTMENKEKNVEMPSFLYYFNYLAYPMIAIMVMCISAIMLIINKLDVKRRNICSPISMSSFNIQLFTANIVMAVALFLLFFIYAVILYNKNIFTLNGIFVAVNAFILTIVCLSLCFLIANVAKERSVSAIANLLSLGGCFLGGVFVPQSLLSDTVKNVAVINPIFWYVKANNLLGSVNTFNYETLKPALFAMLIQICFAVAFLAISLVIIKQKRTQEQ